ncbi:MAG TPA: S8 family serine peptidase [Pyrinomonadaceae bacterium]|nr:S8 family serine peptidase [Pyrinomonadaceae bacterium]
MANRLGNKIHVAVALVLVVLLSSVPALAGLTIVGSNGITASGADGINYWNTSGITASGADSILAFSPNGITASGADGITASGADGITASGADGITASGADSTAITRADSLTAAGPNGITISGADGSTYQADSVVVRNPTGITASGADNVIATGTNGITASGADTRNIAHADGITASGADNVITINGASGITGTSSNGVIFSVTPSAVTIAGVSGITASGADGITISGADSFVLTGVAALMAALNGAGVNTGIANVDPELAVLLDRATDDSNIDAVIVYRAMPTDGDIADLQEIGVLGGTRYRALPMVSVTTSKTRLMAISHLAHVRSIYGNRTLQWNLDVASRNTIGSDRVRRNTELTNLNQGTPVTGKGVTVAVLDTGVDGTHSDISGRVVQNVKLADTQSLGVGFNYPVVSPNMPDTDQVYGHGTFVAGVIAGNGQQSGGKYAGVASGANILGLSAGDASLFFILSGLDYLLANAQAFNVRVLNCSFSANTVFDINDPVNIATKMLTDAGVNVVFSAGNTGPGADSLNPYSVAPWVISVGATDYTGKLADFSARGEFGSPLFRPTLVAPGVRNVSLRPSTLVSVTTASGSADDVSQLSATELPFYTTGSGTSFSAPQVAGVIALMLEANPQLTPAQVRDILQRTSTPLPAYYVYEVGAGMLNAPAAVLEAAFPQRHFGSWRGAAFQNQVQFVQSSPQTFTGSATSGSAADSALTVPADTVRASLQIAWGLTSVNRLSLALLDPTGTQQAIANAKPAPGLTGRRQRSSVDSPAPGTWTARVTNVAGSTSTSGTGDLVTINGTPVTNTTTGGGASPQSFYGVFQTVSARYAQLNDLNGLDSSSVNEINQSFRSMLMAPIGSRFRPSFAVTRADFAKAMVMDGRVPQYLPGASSYPDVRDKATMLFVASAQASPSGALFPSITAGSNFQPDAVVDRLTAAVALVRAAGLRQQAESGTYTLSYADALSIPSSLRGYVAVAVQNGLIKTSPSTFNPAGAFTRLDLAHAMSQLAGMPLQ